MYPCYYRTGNASDPIWIRAISCSSSSEKCFIDCTQCPLSPITGCSHSEDITLDCGKYCLIYLILQCTLVKDLFLKNASIYVTSKCMMMWLYSAVNCIDYMLELRSTLLSLIKLVVFIIID